MYNLERNPLLSLIGIPEIVSLNLPVIFYYLPNRMDDFVHSWICQNI